MEGVAPVCEGVEEGVMLGLDKFPYIATTFHLLENHLCLSLVYRYGNASVWKTFTDLFDYFPLTALVSTFVS